jgi:NAD(P)-dependent dehydrogenase (short-subunit alcohol dehydrogenase family)
MEGRKAVVVGAGQPRSELLGNGRAIALLLAQEGAEICAVDIDVARAEETARLVGEGGGMAHAIAADTSNPAECTRIVDEAKAAMGRIDVLVNNVGVNHGDGNPVDLDEDGWQQIMDVNMRGTWLTSRAVVPLMQAQGGGAITNISSIGARTGGGPLFAYSVSKAGVDAMTHFFAVSYAPWGIRCNSVLPAWIATPHSVEGLRDAGIASEDQFMAFGRRSNPLGRMGSALDVARAVLFLSSDEAGFVTGAHLPVDGGALAVVGRYQRPADAPEPAPAMTHTTSRQEGDV